MSGERVLPQKSFSHKKAQKAKSISADFVPFVLLCGDDRYYHVADYLIKLDYGKVTEQLPPPHEQAALHEERTIAAKGMQFTYGD